MSTKWDYLTKRATLLREQSASAQNYLDGLDLTPCGLMCDACDTFLATEGDFARHFDVPDSRYLNLGWCPNKDRTTTASGETETP